MYGSAAAVSAPRISEPEARVSAAAARASDVGVGKPSPKRAAVNASRIRWSDPSNAEIAKAAFSDYVERRQAAPGVQPNISQLSISHKVPYNTLKRLIKNHGKPVPLGKTPTLPLSLETRLADLVEYRFNFGKPLEWDEVRICAKRLFNSMNEVLGDNGCIESFEATSGWLRGFRNRFFSSVTGRKPELVSKGRAAAANPHSIRNEVETRIRALEMVDMLNGGQGIAENVPAERKWNTDESGFAATASRKEVAVPKGAHDCTIIGEDHGEKISAALLVSAAGHAAAPYYILPGARNVASQLDNGRLKGTHPYSGNDYDYYYYYYCPCNALTMVGQSCMGLLW